MMMITVVGGLGSIILGVAIIAIALKLVRTMNAHPYGAAQAQTIYYFVVAVVLLILTVHDFVAMDKGRPIAMPGKSWRLLPRLVQRLLVVYLLLAGLYGLALLGYAAGIK